MYNNTKYKYPKNLITYGDFSLPVYGVIHNRNLNFPNASLNHQKIPTISLKNIINPRLPTKKNLFGNIWYPNMYIDLNYNPKTGGYINANGAIGPYFAQGQGNYPRSMYKQVYFGTPKRNRSPDKYDNINYYHVFESYNPDEEEQQIQNILDNPESKRGDKIIYVFNNQTSTLKSKRIFTDRQGNKKVTNWQYENEDEEFNFGTTKKNSKTNKNKIVYCLPNEKKYPVNTKKKCSAALSYARYAPEPCKIARCVEKNCKKKYPTVGSYSKLVKDCKKTNNKLKKK